MLKIGEAWVQQLRHVISNGRLETSRVGDVLVCRDARPMQFELDEKLRHFIKTYVLSGFCLTIEDTFFPAKRQMNSKFYVADAKTVLQGLDNISLIKPTAPKYGELYTADGWTIPDAYGPPYVKQRDWVVEELSKNQNSRRASIIIYSHPEDPSNHSMVGIPCTLSWTFSFDTKQTFHMHACLRSSDVWVGLPNDMFVMAAVAEDILRDICLSDSNYKVCVTVSAINSHLYLKYAEKALRVIGNET